MARCFATGLYIGNVLVPVPGPVTNVTIDYIQANDTSASVTAATASPANLYTIMGMEIFATSNIFINNAQANGTQLTMPFPNTVSYVSGICIEDTSSIAINNFQSSGNFLTTESTINAQVFPLFILNGVENATISNFQRSGNSITTTGPVSLVQCFVGFGSDASNVTITDSQLSGNSIDVTDGGPVSLIQNGGLNFFQTNNCTVANCQAINLTTTFSGASEPATEW